MAKYSLYVIKSLTISMGSELPRFLKLDTADHYQACKCNLSSFFKSFTILRMSFIKIRECSKTNTSICNDYNYMIMVNLKISMLYSCLSLATCELPFTDMAGALVSIVVRVMISLYEIHPKISPAHWLRTRHLILISAESFLLGKFERHCL